MDDLGRPRVSRSYSSVQQTLADSGSVFVSNRQVMRYAVLICQCHSFVVLQQIDGAYILSNTISSVCGCADSFLLPKLYGFIPPFVP